MKGVRFQGVVTDINNSYIKTDYFVSSKNLQSSAYIATKRKGFVIIATYAGADFPMLLPNAQFANNNYTRIIK